MVDLRKGLKVMRPGLPLKSVSRRIKGGLTFVMLRAAEKVSVLYCTVR